MKKLASLGLLAIIAMLPVMAIAQDSRDHIEVGAFADYFRLGNALTLPPFPSNTLGFSSGATNYGGLGGRFGIGVANHVNLEADMSYDFAQDVTANFSGVTVARSSLRLWDGVFGPMVWFGSKHARVFVEAKGGFLNTNFSGGTALSSFISGLGNFNSSNTSGALYPGGGAEISLGPIGLRAEAGDFMYFNNGTQHNFDLRVGPTIHF